MENQRVGKLDFDQKITNQKSVNTARSCLNQYFKIKSKLFMDNVYKHLVIGGGIIGASLANKLALSSSVPEIKSSVCLLEKYSIASGTTSKSAGVIIKTHKTELATKLAARTLHDLNSFTKSKQLDSFAKVGTFSPIRNIKTTEDGFVDPYQLTHCYTKEARKHGVRLLENYPVERIDKIYTGNNEYIFSINNDIYAQNVYNTTGIWASAIAKGGRHNELPVAYMRSHYWEFSSTGNSSNFKPKPVFLFPGMYIKFQRNKFEVGIQEEESFIVEDPINDHLPSENSALPSLINHYETLKEVVPNFENARLRNYVTGISTYTADGLPVIDIEEGDTLGEGSFVTISGCNGYGVTWAGGISSMLAGKENALISQLNSNRFSNLTRSEIIRHAQDIRNKKFSK